MVGAVHRGLCLRSRSGGERERPAGRHPALLRAADAVRSYRKLRKAEAIRTAQVPAHDSGLEITAVDVDTMDMQSNYLVLQTRADGESRLYQAGRYFDRVVCTVDGWRYQRKRAIYDALDPQTLSAAPI
jgi:hypothetical protein